MQVIIWNLRAQILQSYFNLNVALNCKHLMQQKNSK